jgi:hypothetical protein
MGLRNAVVNELVSLKPRLNPICVTGPLGRPHCSYVGSHQPLSPYEELAGD